MDKAEILKDFYKGTSVLISGGSGFLGKTLIEHLLRKTEVERIYTIIRPKKGQTSEQRSELYFNDVMFTLLKRQRPDAAEKVTFIPGDLSKKGLGLSEIHRRIIEENVHLVFHCAATVTFNENLKHAIFINIGGTKCMLELAEKMPNLKAFVHVSTAFSHFHLLGTDIPENVSLPENALGPFQLLDLAKCIDEGTADKITPVVNDCPNTYLYTKRAAESLVTSYTHLPVGIFRPAVILAANKEPTPGWIDNYYGPTGLFAGLGAGLLHTFLIKEKTNANIVPVDMTVNCLISTAWDINDRKNKSKEVGVYNYASDPGNILSWSDLLRASHDAMNRHPPIKKAWHAFYVPSACRPWFAIIFFFLTYLPALFMDKVGQIFGTKPSFVRTIKRLETVSYIFENFTLRSWTYKIDNVNDLWDRLTDKDKSSFPFLLKKFHWDSYIDIYIKGMNSYLLKMTPAESQEAKLKNYKFFWIHWIVVVAITSSIITSVLSTNLLMMN